MYDELRKASEVFTFVRSSEIIYKLIIAYHVYYDCYKIDRNKQSKITVHETDILYNSHSMHGAFLSTITPHGCRTNHISRH